jgi:hypothetical protein
VPPLLPLRPRREREPEQNLIELGLGGPRSREGAHHVDSIASRRVPLTPASCKRDGGDWRKMSDNVPRCRVAHWTTFALLEFGERQVRSPRMRRRVSLGLQQTSAPGAHYIRRQLAHASPWAATVFARARARSCRHPHAIRILGRARGRASSGAAGKTAWPTILAAIAPARCLRHDRDVDLLGRDPRRCGWHAGEVQATTLSARLGSTRMRKGCERKRMKSPAPLVAR